jgi:hypothetical protein
LTAIGDVGGTYALLLEIFALSYWFFS